MTVSNKDLDIIEDIAIYVIWLDIPSHIKKELLHKLLTRYMITKEEIDHIESEFKRMAIENERYGSDDMDELPEILYMILGVHMDEFLYKVFYMYYLSVYVRIASAVRSGGPKTPDFMG